jgi:hypothetical protein
VFQNGPDDLPGFNEGDDSHDSPTLPTDQGIDPVDFLNEPRLALPVFLRTFIGFQRLPAGHQIKGYYHDHL